MQHRHPLWLNLAMLRIIFLVLFFASAQADTLSITDGTEGERYPGKFIWTDLVSTDIDAAAAFYGQLFGWQISPYDENYRVIRNQGQLIGGISRNAADNAERSHWISYVSIGDVDAAHTRLIEAGATPVVEPLTIEGRGQFGIYHGPDGAVFGVLDAEQGDPPERGADIGDWIWIELWSKRPQLAAAFYDDLGYTVARNWASANEADQLLVAGDYARAGIVEGHPEQKRSGWLLYVRVADIAATLSRAKSLGGKPLQLSGDANPNGDIAIVQDPTGGVVALYQYTVQPESLAVNPEVDQ